MRPWDRMMWLSLTRHENDKILTLTTIVVLNKFSSILTSKNVEQSSQFKITKFQLQRETERLEWKWKLLENYYSSELLWVRVCLEFLETRKLESFPDLWRKKICKYTVLPINDFCKISRSSTVIGLSLVEWRTESFPRPPPTFLSLSVVINMKSALSAFCKFEVADCNLSVGVLSGVRSAEILFSSCVLLWREECEEVWSELLNFSFWI